jgi:hypothetical protein
LAESAEWYWVSTDAVTAIFEERTILWTSGSQAAEKKVSSAFE